MGQLQKRKVAIAIAIAMTSSNVQAAKPSAGYCEANRVSADRAADQAVQTFRDLRKAGATAAAGGGCALLSLVVFGLDAGVSSLICAAVMAGTWASVSPEESATIATRAFLKARDKRCF